MKNIIRVKVGWVNDFSCRLLFNNNRKFDKSIEINIEINRNGKFFVKIKNLLLLLLLNYLT
jgi:hypothetical protein